MAKPAIVTIVLLFGAKYKEEPVKKAPNKEPFISSLRVNSNKNHETQGSSGCWGKQDGGWAQYMIAPSRELVHLGKLNPSEYVPIAEVQNIHSEVRSKP